MHLIEVGEESGKLDTMLNQVADVYDVEVRNSIKNLIAFFEPALILLMGIVIEHCRFHAHGNLQHK